MAQSAPTLGDERRSPDEPPAPGASGAAAGGDAAAPHEAFGVLRERYELRERLDHGRIGNVYKAVDRLKANWGDSLVEVLVLPRDIARAPERRAAFARGLRSVQSLNHSGIVEIRDFDGSEEPYFLVLEWVDGESLRTITESLYPERLCHADSVAILRTVAEALSYAHARGIVHGDVRAENVLVTGGGVIKLMFTSACLIHTGPVEATQRDDVAAFAALAGQLLLQPDGAPLDTRDRRRQRRLREALDGADRHSSIPPLLAELGIDPRFRPLGPRRAGRRRGRSDASRARPARATAYEPRSGVGRGALAAGLILGAGAVAAGLLGLARERPDWVAAARASVQGAASDAREMSALALTRLSAAGLSAREWLADTAAEVGAGAPEGSEAAPLPGEAAPSGEAAPHGEAPPPGDAVPPGEGAPQDESATPPGEVAPVQGNAGTADAATADAATANAATANAATADAGEEAARDATDDTSAAGRTGAAAGDEGSVSRGGRADDATSTAASRPTASAARTAVTFARDDILVVESAAVATLELRRSGPLDDELIVLWWTDDGTAVAGDDYADLGRVVDRFAPGEESKPIYIPITSDSIAEPFEYFDVYVGVGSAQGRPVGVPERARVTIRDDD